MGVVVVGVVVVGVVVVGVVVVGVVVLGWVVLGWVVLGTVCIQFEGEKSTLLLAIVLRRSQKYLTFIHWHTGWFLRWGILCTWQQQTCWVTFAASLPHETTLIEGYYHH